MLRMKYVAPKAEIISFDVESIMWLSNLCIIDDAMNPECEDKLPDFYG